MRWKTLDLDDPNHRAQRNAMVERIDSFWEHFARDAGAIRGVFDRTSELDLPQWMATSLGTIDERIMWEFGPAVRGPGHRLVLTPESARTLRPLVDTLVERAPQFEGWEFYTHRLAEPLEMAEQTVTARTGGSLGDTSVSVDAGRGNVLNLCFYSPTTRSEDDDAAWDTAMVACESLLGERTLDRWVGSVSVAPRRPKGLFGSLKRTSRNPTEQVALPDLRATVEAAADQIRGRLPPQPYCRRSEAIERTLFRTDPRHGADCPRQADRMIGNSVDPELWLAAHGGGLFYDERFSRHDETFCYVKIEGLPADEGSEIEARGRLEDAIDAALVSAGLGCHIGGSTGLAHAYIDLALLRADEALPVVRRVLRELGVPQRSWVLFCSSDLEGEWVGIHPNTPPPSLPNV